MAEPLQHLTQKEVTLLALTFSCFKTGFDNSSIDFDKLSGLGGYTNVQSCRNAMANIRKKLSAIALNSSNEQSGDAASGVEPAKAPSKGRAASKKATDKSAKVANPPHFPNLKRKNDGATSPSKKSGQKQSNTTQSDSNSDSKSTEEFHSEDSESAELPSPNKVRKTAAAIRTKKGKAQQSSAGGAVLTITTSSSDVKKDPTDAVDENGDSGHRSASPVKADPPATTALKGSASAPPTPATKKNANTGKGKGKRTPIKKDQSSENEKKDKDDGTTKASPSGSPGDDLV